MNFSNLIHSGEALKDDPFVLSSQVKQVFYVKDHKEGNWLLVVMTKPRDLYDMGKNAQGEDDESYTQCMPSSGPSVDDTNVVLSWRRVDIDAEDN